MLNVSIKIEAMVALWNQDALVFLQSEVIAVRAFQIGHAFIDFGSEVELFLALKVGSALFIPV